MVPSAPLNASRARAIPGLLPAALLVLVAAWEIAAVARAGSDLPGAGDWEGAAAFVRERHRPGELLVAAPAWLDPVARMHLGDLIPIEMAGRMDADRFGVLWELSARGARAPETRGLEPALTERFGRLTVRRYEQEPVEVLTDFVEAFAGRAAATSGEVGPARCRATRPDPRPQVSLEEVGFAPRRCVRVIPRADGTATIAFRGVALGGRLVGHVGLADVFERRDVRDPARLEVAVNGHQVATATAGVDDGWVRFEAATEPAAAADVEFSATAVGAGAHCRIVCFAAEARR
jgi:hypothetical protein